MTRVEFCKLFPSIYYYLYSHNKELLNKVFPKKLNPIESKKRIFELSKELNRRLKKNSNNKEESVLANRLSGYLAKSSKTYDPIFAAEYNEKFPIKKVPDIIKSIWDFSLKYGRRPYKSSDNIEECNAAIRLQRFSGKSYQKRYADFYKEYNEKFPPRDSDLTKFSIFEFSRKHKRRPKQNSETREEYRLAKALERYTSLNQGCYDSEFTAVYNSEFPPRKWTKKV